jgi:hypothetical protein
MKGGFIVLRQMIKFLCQLKLGTIANNDLKVLTDHIASKIQPIKQIKELNCMILLDEVGESIITSS